MSKETIKVGLDPNDGTGDSLRAAGFKINNNFNELYAAIQSGINAISPGEGIDVTNSFGQVTVTNLYPNRGTFKRIAVSGQSTIEADNLEDTLTLVAGNNVTLTTNSSTDTLTIAVNVLDIGELNGDFSGTFTGQSTGMFEGSVLSDDIETTFLKISGDPSLSQAYYNELVNQQTGLNNDISLLNAQLQQLELDLGNLQDDLAVLLSAPIPDPVAIQAVQDEIDAKQAEINGVQLEITLKEEDLAIKEAAIFIIEPTLDYPYVGLTYNTISLEWTATRHLHVPALTVGSITLPSVDGTAGQIIITDGNGNLSWTNVLVPTASASVLGLVKVDDTSITITNGVISSNTGDITFNGSHISSSSGYPILTNNGGTIGPEIDFVSNDYEHAMWLNGMDGLKLSLSSIAGSYYWQFTPTGTLNLPNGAVIRATEVTQVNAGSTSVTYYNYDASQMTVSIAIGDTVEFPNFSGQVIINDIVSGQVELWLCGGGFAARLGTSKDGNEPTTLGTFEHTLSNAGYTWTSAIEANMVFVATRTRSTA